MCNFPWSKLEAGQVKLQSRLEEEEQAKAALMGRIQRLTKLILVSTKNSMQSSLPERSDHIRRHSFGEDEVCYFLVLQESGFWIFNQDGMVYGFLILLLLQLAYLPDRKREYMTEEDAGSYASELSVEGRDEITNLDELVKDFKRNRRRGMLGWFKLKVRSCALKEDPFHECLIRDGSGSL